MLLNTVGGLAVYAETPSNIVLVGSLGAGELASLVSYCGRLHGNGQTELHLNLDGVTACDLPGLQGLVGLADHPGMAVSVAGARWGQFMGLLAGAPISDVQRLCDDVRGLVGSSTGAPRS